MKNNNDEEIQKLILKAREELLKANEERRIGPDTELRYYFKKLDFLEKWIAGNLVEKINQMKAKEGGYGWHAYHIGVRPFDWDWKVETGEIVRYA